MNTPDVSSHPLSQVARVLTWGALGLLAYGTIGWLVAQPWFALRAIELETPVAHVTEAQIRLVAERKVHGTFFTVDLERVRESIEKLPWVREARVERRWPDTLVVSVIEHVPLARWNEDALVNADGQVFVAAVSEKLPRLAGPEDSCYEVVGAYNRHLTALAPLGVTISELRLSPRRAWSMRLDNGMQLALGREQTDARLARFIALYPRLFTTAAAAGQTGANKPADVAAAPAAPAVPVSVDLRYPDGFAVRMPHGASPFKPSET
jgi:cell division protein FtsQ